MAQGGVKPLEVVWLRKALLNLDEEAIYIVQDNPKEFSRVENLAVENWSK